jgi:hypothetical protein
MDAGHVKTNEGASGNGTGHKSRIVSWTGNENVNGHVSGNETETKSVSGSETMSASGSETMSASRSETMSVSKTVSKSKTVSGSKTEAELGRYNNVMIAMNTYIIFILSFEWSSEILVTDADGLR